MASDPQPARRSRKRGILLSLGFLAVVIGLWSGWAERYPQRERELRVELQEQLQERFPEAMRAPDGYYGLSPQDAGDGPPRNLAVVLIHGLDEPGNIFDDLVPVLAAAGYDRWIFRYPNDQGIDQSADLLAAHWPELPADQPVILIGHSMGGLVARDFVSRWRHPVGTAPAVDGAPVGGAILVGTPNQGSEWSRMRVLLEPRDMVVSTWEQGFSPLAAYRDGTGAAKIDLLPGSRFLDTLNSRAWPDRVPVRTIGGLPIPHAPAFGDGVVPLDALELPGAPSPIVVSAFHRGLLKRLLGDQEPPAIPVIMDLLAELDRER